MKIGLFGGTFDPIHLGHLIVAEQVRETAKLDSIWFLPSFEPPHKSEHIITPFDDRLTMVQLAVQGRAEFRVEPIERDLPRPSYTVRTLAALKQHNPGAEFYLILGADCLPDLPMWYQPRRLLEQATLIAVPRPGMKVMTAAALAVSLQMRAAEIRLQTVACPLIDIASRDLRARVAAGRSIRYFVPDAVEHFIRERSLYRGGP